MLFFTGEMMEDEDDVRELDIIPQLLFCTLCVCMSSLIWRKVKKKKMTMRTKKEKSRSRFILVFDEIVMTSFLFYL